jgi:hypothetical protein
MPISGILIVLILSLSLLPGQEMLTIFILPLLLPFVAVSHAISTAFDAKDQESRITLIVICAVFLPIAAILLKQLRSNLTDRQRGRYLNALILVLGVPAIMILAALRVESWGHH